MSDSESEDLWRDEDDDSPPEKRQKTRHRRPKPTAARKRQRRQRQTQQCLNFGSKRQLGLVDLSQTSSHDNENHHQNKSGSRKKPRVVGFRLPTPDVPASLPAPTTSTPSSTASSTRAPRRRNSSTKLSWPAAARRVTDSTPARESSSSSKAKKSIQHSELWTDRYVPHTTTDLCVAPKRVADIRGWLMASSHSKLLVLVGSPGVGKSTAVRCLAHELRLRVDEWSNESAFAGGTASALQSFNSFLQQTRVAMKSVLLRDNMSAAADGDRPSSHESIVLLDDLPNLHENHDRFRAIMNQHLRESLAPTVLIFSNVSEGKHKPADLEQLIPAELLYNETVTTILQVHPATKSRHRKALERVVTAEKLSASSSIYEDLFVRSGGDVRYAISTLQFEHGGRDGSNYHRTSETDRDVKLSTFHALGKLLYAKRESLPPPPPSDNVDAPCERAAGGLSHWSDTRPPLQFDPELVLAHSDLELLGALHFLNYHSLEFFTDVSEVSQAWELLSDAAMLLHHQNAGGNRQDGSSVFPDGYVASLSSRAVAATNRHPTVNKFRQLNAPKVFEVMRKRRENQGRLLQMRRRLEMTVSPARTAVGLLSVGGEAQFATEMLPYARKIAPHKLGAMDQLYSLFRSDKANHKVCTDDAARQEHLLREQEKVLGADDIEEFID